MKIKNKKLIFILFLIVIIGVGFLVWLHFSGEPEGVNLAIRNYINEDFLLELKISNEKGILLSDLSVPIINLDSETKDNVFYSYYDDNSLNFEFKSLVVRLKLRRIPDGAIMDEEIGLYPKTMGESYSAYSNRILITIMVKKDDSGRPFLDLSGKGFI